MDVGGLFVCLLGCLFVGNSVWWVDGGVCCFVGSLVGWLVWVGLVGFG